MKTHQKKLPNHSLDELAQGFLMILEKNRVSLSVKELKLCYDVLENIEFLKIENSRKKIREFVTNIASLLLRLCLDTDVIKTISQYL